MKQTPPITTFICAIISICQLLVSSVSAQDTSNPTIENAAALINQGKLSEARSLLATILPSDPAYALAQGYRVAAADPTDDLGVLKIAEKTALRTLDMPAELKQQVLAREIRALFKFRKFDPLLAKTSEFMTAYPNSMQTEILDYRLAGLFDRGMKQAEDACRFYKEEDFNVRWPEAKGNLEEFLGLVKTGGVTNYAALPKRDLKRDVWVARMTLGDDGAVLNDVMRSDPAEYERVSFLRLRLYQRLQRLEADKNLAKAREFLAQFPGTIHKKRVEFEMAEIALVEAERLLALARRGGKASVLAEKRSAAAAHLETAHELFNQVVEDKVAGIGATELRESRTGKVRIYYAQMDWEKLSKWCGQLLANSPDEKEWLVVRLYEGAGLANQYKPAEAAAAMDDVLTLGFRNTPSYDGLLISAAEWRLLIARDMGDEVTVRKVVEQVQNANCYVGIKRKFLNKYGMQIAPATK